MSKAHRAGCGHLTLIDLIDSVCSVRECDHGAAGRLLNALRQECVHQLGVPMDNVRLVTAWDSSRLQVSNVGLSGLCWLRNVHALHFMYHNKCCI